MMDVVLNTELATNKAPLLCTLIRIDLASGTVCLTDQGFAYFDSGDGVRTYYGVHDYVGTFTSVSKIEDGAEKTTTRVNIIILPSNEVAVADLSAPTNQGARVRWWEGAMDANTGLLIGQPLLKFEGELDKCGFWVGESWTLTLACGTQAERQLEANADWRLNDPLQKKIWPGDNGCANVTNVLVKTEWRSRPPDVGLFKRLIKAFVPIANL